MNSSANEMAIALAANILWTDTHQVVWIVQSSTMPATLDKHFGFLLERFKAVRVAAKFWRLTLLRRVTLGLTIISD